jgi:hypothetical protein
MDYTKLNPRFTPGAKVEEIAGEDHRKVYRLSIPAGKADKYRLAQLDGYTKTRRGQFLLRSPITMSLSARASSDSIPGTWGFGLWNDPFGLSLGFGGNPFQLPALPNAVWFFGASKDSFLSFRDPPTALHSTPRKNAGTHLHDGTSAPSRAVPVSQREVAATGFLAQTFRSPGFHPMLIPAGLALPFSRKTTRQMLGRVIDEDGVRLNVDVTQWHQYKLDWREERVSFEVDDAPVFESTVSPKPPLGLVIWIDNQYAAFTPEGKIGFGVLENSEPAWMEIKDIGLNM